MTNKEVQKGFIISNLVIYTKLLASNQVWEGFKPGLARGKFSLLIKLSTHYPKKQEYAKPNF